jgi:nicotinamide phosphoribosyltransferase
VRNSRGYKVLPKYLRVIQGDGISEDTLPDILTGLMNREISISNIAFGMGGGLLQKCDRDTLSFAMKASQVTINGVTRDIRKEPITDSHKKSKAGRFAVVHDYMDDGKLTCVREAVNVGNILTDVFRDGKMVGREATLEDIRQNAWHMAESLV